MTKKKELELGVTYPDHDPVEYVILNVPAHYEFRAIHGPIDNGTEPDDIYRDVHETVSSARAGYKYGLNPMAGGVPQYIQDNLRQSQIERAIRMAKKGAGLKWGSGNEDGGVFVWELDSNPDYLLYSTRDS